MHNLTKIKIFRILLWITYPVSWLIMYPASLLKKKNPGHLFFFFDRYCIGGAQRVHLDILNSIRDQPKQVYFTRYSPDNMFKKDFYDIPATHCRDIHTWCDNLLFRLFTVHYYAFYINRHPEAHIFGSNSTFFYDLLPFLKKGMICTELLHNFTYGKKGFEFFGLANHARLHNRIVVDASTRENIKQQYATYGVDKKFDSRILLIEPGVHIPPEPLEKNYEGPLQVLYAGRGGAQKRVWLVSKIADYFIGENLPVTFHFAGPVQAELSGVTLERSVVHGEVKGNDMPALYAQCQVLILTSAYEGFPMVIKEAMAYGCVPVVTALEGNKTHLKNGQNALLIEAVTDEAAVVQQGIEQIRSLIENTSRLQELAAAAREYAKKHFSKDVFMQAYRKLLT
jgi:glycosyltransferase involved in cell wall biosynthesis